ncbi:TetR/AcrR family transcriptional regulator [Mesorhizobium australicum]|jgi:AcrR family transcriptional regulator|uniref:Transcriptional regulator, TetR family n=1 Tax=Mesorhizobium australicum TaxID=536018 RepID=A0A1X7PLF0_9HYPH|nr:TetR/AcrR family transcriptional regulator [Mesorhizobium australicum]SMH51852.1 transcriptional regulator, TetR family [Mesorhizobium australicum]
MATNPTNATAAPPLPREVRKPRLSRAEKAEATRARLFEAAIEIVGELGYAGASVALITARANVAQGTFYNYFESRQDLLDQLLPSISERLHELIRQRVMEAPDDPIEREKARLAGFFEFLEKEPHLFKILSEGSVQAPRGFRAHLETQSASYRRALEYERRRGNLLIDDPLEIDILMQMLISTREYLSGRFCYEDGDFVRPAPSVVDTYVKLLRGKVFK